MTEEFLIEYDNGSPGVVLIDGVAVSVELLTTMIVRPDPNKWFKFERDGDLVTVRLVLKPEVRE